MQKFVVLTPVHPALVEHFGSAESRDRGLTFDFKGDTGIVAAFVRLAVTASCFKLSSFSPFDLLLKTLEHLLKCGNFVFKLAHSHRQFVVAAWRWVCKGGDRFEGNADFAVVRRNHF